MEKCMSMREMDAFLKALQEHNGKAWMDQY